MSSFFAHGVVGMTVWGFARRTPAFESFRHKGWFALAGLVSILPDLDSYIGLRHRGVTHTLGFALVVSAVIALAAARVHGQRALWLMVPFSMALWLHGFMDLLVGGGPRVQLFAPLWDQAFRPFEGGLPIHGVPRSWDSVIGRLMERTLPGMAVEAGIFGAFFAASIVRQRRYQIVLLITGALTWLIYGLLS